MCIVYAKNSRGRMLLCNQHPLRKSVDSSMVSWWSDTTGLQFHSPMGIYKVIYIMFIQIMVIYSLSHVLLSVVSNTNQLGTGINKQHKITTPYWRREVCWSILGPSHSDGWVSQQLWIPRCLWAITLISLSMLSATQSGCCDNIIHERKVFLLKAVGFLIFMRQFLLDFPLILSVLVELDTFVG